MLLVTGLKDRTRNTKNYIKIVDNPYSNTPFAGGRKVYCDGYHRLLGRFSEIVCATQSTFILLPIIVFIGFGLPSLIIIITGIKQITIQTLCASRENPTLHQR